MELNEKDQLLISYAAHIIHMRYCEDHHHIGAALLSKTGNIYQAVHVEAYIGRITLCAEAVAIGMAASAGDLPIDTIVAVGVDGEVVSPCGMCRELITDYGPQAWVIVPGAHGAEKVLIAELLPNKYTR